MVSLDDALKVNSDGNEITFYDILPDTNMRYDNRTMDSYELAAIIQQMFNSLDVRSLIALLFSAAGKSQLQIADKLGITQSYTSRFVKNARAKLILDLKSDDNWQVSCFDGIISITRRDKFMAQFPVGDTLWSNLSAWVADVLSIPKPKHTKPANSPKTRILNSKYNERAKEFGAYIVNQRTTIRKTAEYFCVGRATVHNGITVCLKKVSPELFAEVQAVLAQNKAERHLRGGEATKKRAKSQK